MGLTIYYRLSLSRNLPSEQVRDLVQRVADHVRGSGCVELARPGFAARPEGVLSCQSRVALALRPWHER